MSSSFYELPAELKNLILSNLNDHEMKKYFLLSRESYDAAIWIERIDDKFGIRLTEQQIYSMMYNIIKENVIAKVPINLMYDEDRKLEVLGEMIISPADKLCDILMKIITKYGLLGPIHYGIIYDESEKVDDVDIDIYPRIVELINNKGILINKELSRYSPKFRSYLDVTDNIIVGQTLLPEMNVDLENVTKPKYVSDVIFVPDNMEELEIERYLGIEFVEYEPSDDESGDCDDYIDLYDKCVRWFTNSLKEIVPKAFPKHFEIIIRKHEFTEYEKNFIMQTLRNAQIVARNS